MRVAVVGLGYIGSVTAACLAHLGHDVTGADRDEFKVESINSRRAPFFEPGLEELIAEAGAAGRLRAVTSLSAALKDADVALICVGTPSEKNGNLGLDQLRRVVSEIADTFDRDPQKPPLLVAVRSTVFPGTCETEVMPRLAGVNAVVVSHPEFLREGTSVKDFMEPSLIVAGSNDAAAARRVASLYSRLGVEPAIVSLRTAEMIKYACNAFHAVKIAFANEIGALSGQLGISGEEVMETLCRDGKLNISKAYLRPGFAFGGSCLPKDLRALNFRASRLDLNLPLMSSILDSNQRHLDRAIDAVMSMPGSRIGVFGLTFKENTDDLRESPNVALIEHLIGKGKDVRVYDPQLQLDAIYGSNRNFLLNAIPHVGKILEGDFERLLGWADVLVVAQKPDAARRRRILEFKKPVLHLSEALPSLAPATVA